MLWQDLVFTLGSGLSIVFLAPTLRDASARVPLGTSLPSMGIGAAYATTFATLGMTFSAAGSLAAATMWALIAARRSPVSESPTSLSGGAVLFANDLLRWKQRLVSGRQVADQFVLEEAVDSRGDPAGQS